LELSENGSYVSYPHLGCVKSGDCAAISLTKCAPTGGWNTKNSEKLPAVCVPLASARAYCSSAMKALGLNGGRLPTTGEWELMARGPCPGNADAACAAKMRTLPWGESTAPGLAWLDHPAAGVRPVDVDLGDVSPMGIIGLGGNVSEWLQERYIKSLYPSYSGKGLITSQFTQPVSSNSAKDAQIRGGSFASKAVRVSDRQALDTYGSASIGFRCVAPAP
jgi:formylglycine-generating enzyme required for sulfatase activity